jgi:hypothetical protein
MSRFLQRATFYFSLVAILSCTTGDDAESPSPSGNQRSVSVIEPVSPTGTLAGYFYDVFTGQELEGVTVTLLNFLDAEGANLSAQTKADGSFILENIPASSDIALTFQKDGYSSGVTTSSIPSSAGNLAQDNGVGFVGPLGLFPLGGEGALYPKYRLLDASGAVVENMSVSAQLDVAFIENEVPRGSLPSAISYNPTTETFDATGIPDLMGLATSYPNVIVRMVAIASFDAGIQSVVVEKSVAELAATGVVEVAIGEVDVEPEPSPEPEPESDGGSGPEPEPEPEPEYVAPETLLTITSSNIADLSRGTGPRPILPTRLGQMVAMDVRFSRPIHEGSLYILAVNEIGEILTLGSPGVTNSEIVGASSLIVPTPTGGWPQGEEINVRMVVLSEAGDMTLDITGTFLTESASGLAVLADAKLVAANGDAQCPSDNGGTIELRLSEPVGARQADGQSGLLGQYTPIRVTSDDGIVVPQMDGGILDAGDADGGMVANDAGPGDAGQPGIPLTNQEYPVHPEHPLFEGYTGQDRVYAYPYEPASGQALSGYATYISIPWTQPFLNSVLGAGLTSIDLHLRLRFNYYAVSQPTDLTVLRRANGAAVGTLEGTVQLAVSNADGGSCVPSP